MNCKYNVITKQPEKGRKVITLWLLCVSFVITVCLNSHEAGALRFETAIVEGQLAYGQADPKEEIFIKADGLRVGLPAGEWVRIPHHSDGRFVLGVSQDQTHLILKTEKAGLVEERTFPVQARTWQEEVVNGLPPQKVMPDLQDQKRITDEAILIQKIRQHPVFEGKIQDGWQRPLSQFNRISSAFGSRRLLNGVKHQGHGGTDYAAPIGTSVIAPADGVVRLVHPDMFYSGQTVVIDHGFGLFSSYSHLNRIDVRENQVVRTGDSVGAVGMSGRATGPHLHWTVTWFGVRVDPESLVIQKPKD